MITSPNGDLSDLIATPVAGFLTVVGSECLAAILVVAALYALVTAVLNRGARHRSTVVAATALHLRGMARVVAWAAGLVGDVVDAAGASGTVEAIEFRTTRIRGEDGKLNIVRNGDVKQVVNYSKEYVKAVVAVDVAYDQDVRAVFATMQRVGTALRAANADVTGDPEVTGIAALGGAALTARMALRVKPGRHETVAAALRLALKDAFDQAAATGAKRQGVVAVAQTATPVRVRARGMEAMPGRTEVSLT